MKFYNYLLSDVDYDGIISSAIYKFIYPKTKMIGFYNTKDFYLNNSTIPYLIKNRDKILGLDTNLNFIDTIDHHLTTFEYDAHKTAHSNFINANKQLNPSYMLERKNPLNSIFMLISNLTESQYEKLLKNINKENLIALTLYSDGMWQNLSKYHQNVKYWLELMSVKSTNSFASDIKDYLNLSGNSSKANHNYLYTDMWNYLNQLNAKGIIQHNKLNSPWPTVSFLPDELIDNINNLITLKNKLPLTHSCEVQKFKDNNFDYKNIISMAQTNKNVYKVTYSVQIWKLLNTLSQELSYNLEK